MIFARRLKYNHFSIRRIIKWKNSVKHAVLQKTLKSFQKTDPPRTATNHTAEPVADNGRIIATPCENTRKSNTGKSSYHFRHLRGRRSTLRIPTNARYAGTGNQRSANCTGTGKRMILRVFYLTKKYLK